MFPFSFINFCNKTPYQTTRIYILESFRVKEIKVI